MRLEPMNWRAPRRGLARPFFAMNRFLWLGALGLALAGCAANPTANSARNAPSARGLAASFAAGRAYDRAQSALKGGDDAALVAAGRAYERALAKMPRNAKLSGVFAGAALNLVARATILDAQASIAAPTERPALRAQALAKYHAASAFLPAQPAPGSVDANTLNAVGYSLAERGTSRADWQRAEQLTRLSLAEWDKKMKSLAKDDPKRLQMEAARTIGPLDSHAWALFRLERYQEALEQQERVLKFARTNSIKLTADVPFHLAEIYRALGRDEDARREYEAALALNPDAELALKIDAALTGKIV